MIGFETLNRTQSQFANLMCNPAKYYAAMQASVLNESIHEYVSNHFRNADLSIQALEFEIGVRAR